MNYTKEEWIEFNTLYTISYNFIPILTHVARCFLISSSFLFISLSYFAVRCYIKWTTSNSSISLWMIIKGMGHLQNDMPVHYMTSLFVLWRHMMGCILRHYEHRLYVVIMTNHVQGVGKDATVKWNWSIFADIPLHMALSNSHHVCYTEIKEAHWLPTMSYKTSTNEKPRFDSPLCTLHTWYSFSDTMWGHLSTSSWGVKNILSLLFDLVWSVKMRNKADDWNTEVNIDCFYTNICQLVLSMCLYVKEVCRVCIMVYKVI